jgi:hypothetical protein
MELLHLFKTIPLLLSLEAANLLPALCWVESKHKVQAVAHKDGRSSSYGICQVKLETANWMKEYYRIPGVPLTERQLMKPDVNIFYAGLYLKYHIKSNPNNLKCAISAYNAGRCIKGNQATYVKQVLNKMRELNKAHGIVFDDTRYEVVVLPYGRGHVPKEAVVEPSHNLFD